jgi:hypothetical protein
VAIDRTAAGTRQRLFRKMGTGCQMVVALSGSSVYW